MAAPGRIVRSCLSESPLGWTGQAERCIDSTPANLRNLFVRLLAKNKCPYEFPARSFRYSVPGNIRVHGKLSSNSQTKSG